MKTDIGTTVSRMTPFDHAAAARCCDWTANASARSFVIAGKRSWRFSAVAPIVTADVSTSRSATKRGLKSTSVAHRVVAHVLDAAREHDVRRAHRDLARAGGHGGQRARAHAVDGEAGNGVRDAGEQRDVAPERQPLVADLRRRGEDHVADALGRDRGIAAQELAHGLHGHVVGARAPEDALRPRLPEGGPDPVDVDDLAQLPRHARSGYFAAATPTRKGALTTSDLRPGFIVAASSIAYA